jgi:hypothetical protein
MFPNLSPDEKKQHLKNLVALAVQDEKLDLAEKQILHYISLKWNIPAKQVEAACANPLHEAGAANLPKAKDARFQVLFDFVDLMIADTAVGSKERAFCDRMAQRLGFGSQAVGTIQAAILEANRKGTPVEDIHAGLLAKL